MRDMFHRFMNDLEPHLVGVCTVASLLQDMNISRIQAFAQNLEDHKHQLQVSRDIELEKHKRARSVGYYGESRDGFRPQSSRRPTYPANSAPPQFRGPRYDRYAHSGPDQSSRAPNSQPQGSSSQTRPSLPPCSKYGKMHIGPCCRGSDACYGYVFSGHILRDCPRRGKGVGLSRPGQ